MLDCVVVCLCVCVSVCLSIYLSVCFVWDCNRVSEPRVVRDGRFGDPTVIYYLLLLLLLLVCVVMCSPWVGLSSTSLEALLSLLSPQLNAFLQVGDFGVDKLEVALQPV